MPLVFIRSGKLVHNRALHTAEEILSNQRSYKWSLIKFGICRFPPSRRFLINQQQPYASVMEHSRLNFGSFAAHCTTVHKCLRCNTVSTKVSTTRGSRQCVWGKNRLIGSDCAILKPVFDFNWNGRTDQISSSKPFCKWVWDVLSQSWMSSMSGRQSHSARYRSSKPQLFPR
jgi:hypothetical protein